MITVINIEMEGLREALDMVEPRVLIGRYRGDLGALAERAASLARSHEDAPAASGRFVRSLKGRVTHRVWMIRLDIISNVEYAHYVVEDTGPWSKLPPIAPIAEWVKTKLGITDEKKARGIAFAIAKTKMRTSHRGNKFIEKAMADFGPEMEKVLTLILDDYKAAQQ